MVEGVPGNMGCIPPEPGFLELLASLCRKHGALFVVDEVMSGFRVAPGGAVELYGLEPDLVTFGKIMGGGLPAAAFGGRRALMELLAPLGTTYQAGTLSGNPLAMAAGVATLDALCGAGDVRPAGAHERRGRGRHPRGPGGRDGHGQPRRLDADGLLPPRPGALVRRRGGG